MAPNLMKFVLAVWLVASTAKADTFGSGANVFDIEFVTIGGPGNAADTTGAPQTVGSVPYNYRIGKFEISEQMIDKANALGGLGLTHTNWGADKPATTISWFEVAQFVNWLNTSSDHSPAYKFDGTGDFQLWQAGDPGYNPNNLFRNSLAKYVLPSIDEWYKAAYYDPIASVYYDYPTGSDNIPDGIDIGGDPIFDAVFADLATTIRPNDITDVGALSPYGTAGQGGNVAEWQESDFFEGHIPDLGGRGFRGGDWGEFYIDLHSSSLSGATPSSEILQTGFRVASVPEPNSLVLLGMALLFMYVFSTHFRLLRVAPLGSHQNFECG